MINPVLLILSLTSRIKATCPVQAQKEKEAAKEEAKHGDFGYSAFNQSHGSAYPPLFGGSRHRSYADSFGGSRYSRRAGFSSSYGGSYGSGSLYGNGFRSGVYGDDLAARSLYGDPFASGPFGKNLQEYPSVDRNGNVSWGAGAALSQGGWGSTTAAGAAAAAAAAGSGSAAGSGGAATAAGWSTNAASAIAFGAGRFSGAGFSNSGASGISFKFTHMSMEAGSAEVADYKRSFIASKVFTFTANADGDYKVIMVSTTRFYHPQLKMCEMNQSGGEKYVELNNTDKGNGMYGTKYNCKKGRKYVVEIGASEKINSAPFENGNSGGFICSLSAEKKTLQECLAKEECKVSIGGKIGIVAIENHKDLMGSSSTSSGSSSASMSASSSSASIGGSSSEFGGALDYSVTPYFDEVKASVTLYYHSESSYSFSQTSYSGGGSAASVEFSCSSSSSSYSYSSSSSISEGVKKSNNTYEFNVESKGMCDLSNMLL